MRLGTAAMISAVLTSAVSIADAVYHGLTGEFLLDPDRNATWVYATVAVLLAVTFALVAAVMAQQALRIDAGSRWVRWVRRFLQADLALMSAGSLTILVEPLVGKATVDQLPGAIGGPSFVLMFVLGATLGTLLLRRPDMRLPAILTAAPLAIIPLTYLLYQVAPAWAHPAYAETALYIGLALAGRNGASVGVRATPARTARAAGASEAGWPG
jgi:hypothetical protein